MKTLLAHIDEKLKKVRGLEEREIEYEYKRHFKVIEWLKTNANVSYNLNEEHNYEAGTVKIRIEANEATL